MVGQIAIELLFRNCQWTMYASKTKERKVRHHDLIAVYCMRPSVVNFEYFAIY